MELEHARRCETQLQKRAHFEETDPIDYKLNLNFNKIDQKRVNDSEVPEASMSFNGEQGYIRQVNLPHIEDSEQAESAFD